MLDKSHDSAKHDFCITGFFRQYNASLAINSKLLTAQDGNLANSGAQLSIGTTVDTACLASSKIKSSKKTILLNPDITKVSGTWLL